MRREDIEDALGKIPLPEIKGGDHLVKYLFEVGPTVADGPVTWSDLKAWSDLTGADIQGWQFILLAQMSRAYLSESHAAQKIDAKPPWPEAEKMWQYARNAAAERGWDKVREKEPSNGSRKRHRNPPPG